jgi:hypothetical protein
MVIRVVGWLFGLSLRIDGDFPGTQEVWFAHRELDLKGSAFNAEGMDISDARQGFGYGRALMGDLVDAGRMAASTVAMSSIRRSSSEASRISNLLRRTSVPGMRYGSDKVSLARC